MREIGARVERSGTDIGRAIEVAAGAFGPATHRRIVLLSDGRENLGDARAAATVARSLGIGIDAAALENPAGRGETWVQGMTVPVQVERYVARIAYRAGDDGLKEMPIPPEFGQWLVEEEFIRLCIGEVETPSFTFADGVKNMQYLKAAYVSATERRWVDV